MKKTLTYWYDGVKICSVGIFPLLLMKLEDQAEPNFLVNGIRPVWLRWASFLLDLSLLIVTPIWIRYSAEKVVRADESPLTTGHKDSVPA